MRRELSLLTRPLTSLLLPAAVLVISSLHVCGELTSEASDDVTLLQTFDYAGYDVSPFKFKFLHSARDVCVTSGATKGRPLLALVVVCSAVENASRRDVIRRTWGSPDGSSASPQFRVVFVLGRHGNATGSADAAVAEEARRHGDVIQADFVDTYANLSRKSLAALSWASSYGACASFLIKADDDTFLNTPLLVRDLGACAHRRFVMGHVIARAQPVRLPGAKWYTPLSIYREPAYPTYASGAAYVISGDSIDALLEAAASGGTRFFWIEDVYVTGMLARAAGLQLIVNGKFDGYRTLPDLCAVRNHIVRHRVTTDEMAALWAALTAAKTDLHCNQRILL